MMLAFLCKIGTPLTWVSRDSVTHMHYTLCSSSFIQRSFLSSSSLNKKPYPVEDNAKSSSFTLSYLRKSCRLSPERAAHASKKVTLRNPDGPDSVIKLLVDYGLTRTQISTIIGSHPTLLLANPQKTLLPKLEYLASIGVSRSDMGQVLSMARNLLCCSLKNRFLPNVDFCKNVIGLREEEVVKVLKRSQRFSYFHLPTEIAPSVNVLRELGMPQSVLSKLVTSRPGLLWQCGERLNKAIKEVLDRGYDPAKRSFIHAMSVFSALSAATRERKMEAFRKWGLSEDEIQDAVKKHPVCLSSSEMKIMSVMDFLVNKVGWEPSDVVKHSWIVNFSLEKRIIPRCSVIALLELKGLLKKKPSLLSILVVAESRFAELYVSKYQCEIPELRSVYQRKINFDKRNWDTGI